MKLLPRTTKFFAMLVLASAALVPMAASAKAMGRPHAAEAMADAIEALAR